MIWLLALITTIPSAAAQEIAPLPPTTSQFQFHTCWGGIPCIDMATLTQNLNNALLYSAFYIGLAVFLIGAFMLTISAGQDTLLQSGKRAMKGALIGIAMVTGSYGLYRTALWILYS